MPVPGDHRHQQVSRSTVRFRVRVLRPGVGRGRRPGDAARPIAAWPTSGGSGWARAEFVAFQASARGGVVKVRVVKDRALLGGRAVTVAKGELLVEGDEP